MSDKDYAILVDVYDYGAFVAFSFPSMVEQTSKYRMFEGLVNAIVFYRNGDVLNLDIDKLTVVSTKYNPSSNSKQLEWRPIEELIAIEEAGFVDAHGGHWVTNGTNGVGHWAPKGTNAAGS